MLIRRCGVERLPVVVCGILFAISVFRRHFVWYQRGTFFHDLWFAQIDSLEELVQSCHGNVAAECWDDMFRGFEHSAWWVNISVPRNI